MATDECQSSEDGDSAEEEEDEEEESDDDSEGWITPSNLKQVQQDTGHCDTVPADVQVGCVTTDFSMQVSAASWHWLQPPAWLIPHSTIQKSPCAAFFCVQSCQFSPQQRPAQSPLALLPLASCCPGRQTWVELLGSWHLAFSPSWQNVLLQMGLHVLAVNGMLIRQARSHILRCHGCFRCRHSTTRARDSLGGWAVIPLLGWASALQPRE